MKNLLSLGTLIIAVSIAAVAATYAQTSPNDFDGEADKSMAASHESFVKGDTNKAAEQIRKAAVYLRKESDEVAADAKEGLKKAADELDGLGQDVKKGAVKSGDELSRDRRGLA